MPQVCGREGSGGRRSRDRESPRRTHAIQTKARVPTQANAQACHAQEQDEAARAAAREIATLKESLAEAHAAAADAREVESLRVSLATEKQEKTAAKLEAEQMRARVRRKPLSL